MAEEERNLILSHMRRDTLLKLLEKGIRFDERKVDEWRAVELQKNVIKTAEGSAFVKIGKTQVLAGIKFDIATPYPDRPKEGTLVTSSELLPLANSVFEPGPPSVDSIELARVVDRAVRSSDAIDLNSFFIDDGKVLALYIDLYVLDHAGNFIDASTLAATAALTTARIPKIENGKIIRGEYSRNLQPKSLPVSVTFIKIGSHWLVDPSSEEESAMDTRITIATTDEHVCAIQKGKGSLTQDELMKNIDNAFLFGNELRKIIK